MDVLRNRSLLTIGIAESVSGAGNWITMLAVYAIVVFRGQGGVAQSSAIFLAGLLPTLLASPMAGWLCDRYDRKWLMIGSELADGLIVAGLIFADRLEIIYALVALQAIVMSIMAPARQAVIPDLVPRDAWTRANAFLQQLASMVKIAAPMLAGLVLAVLDPHTAIVLDVISFGASALILASLPALPPARAGLASPHPGQILAPSASHAEPGDQRSAKRSEPAPEQKEPRQSVWSVLRLAWADQSLRLLFVTIFLAITVIVGFDVLASIVTRDVLHGNEALFGLLIGLVGLGSAVSSGWLLLRAGRSEPWRDLALGLALLACLPASLALASGAMNPQSVRLIAGLGCLAGGLGNGLIVVQIATLLQRSSPPAVLGRVSGLFQSTTVAGQLVGILATPLIVPALLSAGQYFLTATAALLLLVLYLSLTLHALRARRAEQAPVGAPDPSEAWR